MERARKAAEDSAKAALLLADLGKQSLSITDRGAVASERSARTAEASFKTTKELFAEGRRAEMSRITTVMHPLEAGKPIKYEVHFLNAGRSRAVSVTTITSADVLGTDQAFPSDPVYRTQNSPSVSVVLPTERIITYGEGAVVQPLLVESLNRGARVSRQDYL